DSLMENAPELIQILLVSGYANHPDFIQKVVFYPDIFQEYKHKISPDRLLAPEITILDHLIDNLGNIRNYDEDGIKIINSFLSQYADTFTPKQTVEFLNVIDKI